VYKPKFCVQENGPPPATGKKNRPPKASLQLRVLRLGFFQDGDVGVGVFSGAKKSLEQAAPHTRLFAFMTVSLSNLRCLLHHNGRRETCFSNSVWLDIRRHEDDQAEGAFLRSKVFHHPHIAIERRRVDRQMPAVQTNQTCQANQGLTGAEMGGLGGD
jgi:hypothetical protein